MVGGLRLEDSHLSKKPEGLPEEEMNYTCKKKKFKI